MSTLDEVLAKIDDRNNSLRDVTNNVQTEKRTFDDLLSAVDATRQRQTPTQAQAGPGGGSLSNSQPLERQETNTRPEASETGSVNGEQELHRGDLTQAAAPGSEMTAEEVQAEFDRRVQELPELGQGGLLAGNSKPDIAKFAMIAALTPNPQELGAILDSRFDNIGVTYEPDGTTFATNNDNGVKVVINKPGFSQMDVLQAAGLASVFTPAGSAAGAVARAGGKLGARMAAASAASTGTQALIEAAQVTQGGSIDPEEVALSGALGAAGEPIGDLVAAGGRRIVDALRPGANQAMQRTKDTFLGGSSRTAARNMKAKPKPQTPQEQIRQASQAASDAELLDPDALERAARFERLNVDPTRGSLTQEFGQQRVEQALGNSSAAGGDILRDAKLRESEQLLKAVHSQLDSLPDLESGKAIKDVLSGRETAVKSEARGLYNSLAELAQGSDTIPIQPGAINKVFTDIDDNDFQELVKGLDPRVRSGLDELFEDFGLVPMSEATKEAKKQARTGIGQLFDAGDDVTPLSINNAEKFRQRLNAINKIDPIGPSAPVINKVIGALDGELEIAFEAGIESPNRQLAEAAKTARDAWRSVKTEFTPDDIVGQLIGKKGDNITDRIKDQDVFKKLISFSSGTRTKDQLSKVVSSLSKEGEQGKRAIQALQRQTLFEAFDRAQKASSSDAINGVQLFNGRGFDKAIKGIGEEELQILFKNNPKALARIKDIAQAGLDVRPDADAKIKGSGGTIIDLLAGKSGLLGKLPPSLSGGLLPLINEMAMKRKNINIAKEAVGAGARQKKIAPKANKIRLSIKNQQIARDLLDNYPSLATAIGLNQVSLDRNLKEEE